MICLLLFLICAFFGLPLIFWVGAAAATLFTLGWPLWWLLPAPIFVIKPLRRRLVSAPLLKAMSAVVPQISETERTALEAGVVWHEGEFFSGRPDFEKIRNQPIPKLSADEQAFMDGPVEELCAMLDNWEIWQKRELPDHVWAFMKSKGFFGLIVPKEYGGLGFSNFAHSEVIQKIGTRCIPATVTVMVPNSLGPAELICHYGTEEQKNEMLPKLASGEEIPCFGLTEPMAGSDAGAMTSSGVIFKEDGKLLIRLNWKKRYITLGSIATTIGLAFQLRDPENHLGRGEALGITAALIPSKTPGVVVGRRHDPLGVPFYNCPIEGHDVVISIDRVIGGPNGCGEGWKMLMESLAAGRGVSLPAQSVGGTKGVVRLASAHARIRYQFGQPIGAFGGIEEPLARAGAFNYMLDAGRRYTLSGLDQGIRPPVVTAIMKYASTEMSRIALNDGMDIMGGNAISLGPRNLIGTGYISLPVGITVEGANILTRTLIIFGQGAFRAHPFAYQEIQAIEKRDALLFDKAFWGHVGHIFQNMARAFVYSITRGHLAPRGAGGPLGRYYQKLAWSSATFATLADIAMALLGGSLKKKESLTGRFADVMIWSYLIMATLNRWEKDGKPKSDLPFVKYSVEHGLLEMQKAIDGILSNMTGLFKPLLWWSRLNPFSRGPSDLIVSEIAQSMQYDLALRDRHTEGIFLPASEPGGINLYEETLEKIEQADSIYKKLQAAVKKRDISRGSFVNQAKQAESKGLITSSEKELIIEAERLKVDAIQVDDFSQTEYLSRSKELS